jgi:hypothetical protein
MSTEAPTAAMSPSLTSTVPLLRTGPLTVTTRALRMASGGESAPAAGNSKDSRTKAGFMSVIAYYIRPA